MIYLDAAATTLQKPDTVRLAVLRAMQRCASVGRGGHPPAMEAAESVYRCRQIAAELFGAEAEQVVFTMNATHALNIAVRSLVHPGDEVVISGFEHNAVWRPLTAAGAELKIAGRRLFDPEDTLRAFDAAVTERTREIGIRKALGARTGSVLLQFLSESAIITLLGGLIGILLGVLGAFGVCGLIGFSAKVKLSTVLGATLFSSAVGIFFGIYPAKKAAKLSPIEALRHE